MSKDNNDDHQDDYQMDEAVKRRELEERKYNRKDPLKQAGKIFAVDEEDLEEEQKEVIAEAARAAPATKGTDDEADQDPLHGAETAGPQALRGPAGVTVTAPVPGVATAEAQAGFVAKGEADKLGGTLEESGSGVGRTVASGGNSRLDVIGPGSGIAGQVSDMIDSATTIAGGGGSGGSTVAVTGGTTSGGTTGGTTSGGTTGGTTSGGTSTTTTSSPLANTTYSKYQAMKENLISINTDVGAPGASIETTSSGDPLGATTTQTGVTVAAAPPVQVSAANQAGYDNYLAGERNTPTSTTTTGKLVGTKSTDGTKTYTAATSAGTTIASTGTTATSAVDAMMAGTAAVADTSTPAKTYTKNTTGTKTLSTGVNNTPEAGTTTMSATEAAVYHNSRGSGLAPVTTTTAKSVGTKSTGGLSSSYLANQQANAAPAPAPTKSYTKPAGGSVKSYSPPKPSSYIAPSPAPKKYYGGGGSGGGMNSFK